MKTTTLRNTHPSRGSALLIVLAFLLLLTTLTIAFLSRATLERQLSNGSFSQGKVDLAGQGAIVAILGDLQQEIVAGSNVSTPTVAAGYYYPTSPLTAVPAVVGFTPGTGVEDLLKISYRTTKFWPAANYTTAGPIRAAAISTSAASLNNRSVTSVRWNKPLLLAPNSATDFTPSSSNFVIPDWIYVARDGSNPTSLSTANIFLPSVAPTTATGTTAGTNPVTQRYAYAIYDEGGTLDMNFAGSPVTAASTPLTYSTLQPYKNVLAYADLTQLPGITGLSSTAQMAFVNSIVSWRNFASANLTGSTYTFPYTSSIPSAQATAFDNNLFLASATGFLGIGGTQLTAGPNMTGKANQSDNAFTSRQQLLQFFLQGLGQNSTFTANVPLSTLVNIMPYLGTFSRDVNQPTYAPNLNRPTIPSSSVLTAAGSGGNDKNGTGADAIINPSLLAAAVSATFTRNDGSTAVVGEPLVKKRFALNRLAWVTYLGPIADNTGHLNNNSSSTLYSAANAAAFTTLINILEGSPNNLTAEFLSQGGPSNIYKNFGLSWVSDTRTNGDSQSKWVYNHESAATPTTMAGATSTVIPIRTLNAGTNTVTSKNRDADFFELLKASVTLGSLGKSYSWIATPGATKPSEYQQQRDNSVDLHILQMGADIIDQFQPTGYCARILFTDGSLFGGTIQEIRGVEDLPYFYRVREGELTVTDSAPSLATLPTTSTAIVTTPGQVAVLQEPEIWNPHAWNMSNPDTNPRPTSFRVVAISTDPNSASSTAVDVTASLVSLNPDGSPTPGSYTQSTPNGKWNEASTELDFNIPLNDLYLFREPTLLIKPNIPTNSSLQAGASTLISQTFPAGYIKTLWQSSQLKNNGVTDDQKYIGFLACTGPAAWTATIPVGSIDGTNPTTASPGVTNATNEGLYPTTVKGITYRMQYNAGTSLVPIWVTYDEKYADYQAAWSFGRGSFYDGSMCFNSAYNNLTTQDNIIGTQIGEVCFDPRTSRFGMNLTGPNGYRAAGQDRDLPPRQNIFTIGWAASNGSGLVTTGTYFTSALGQLALASERPDIHAGFEFTSTDGSPGAFESTGPTTAGWYPTGGITAEINPGMFTQNNPAETAPAEIQVSLDGQLTGNPLNQYFADADGVVRRGMSAYVPTTSSTPATAPASGQPSGIPTVVATDYSGTTPAPFASEQPSRPIMLNRPFRSVADLDYVFSGTPWRNLDVSVPESATCALLDVFCINDTNNPNNMVAGKINLNTRQAAVVNAIVGGTYTDELNPNATTGNSVPLPSSYASKIGPMLVARTQSTTTGQGPLLNLSEIVGKWNSSVAVGTSINGSSSYVGFTSDALNNSNDLTTALSSASAIDAITRVQRFRAAPIRALANATTTRVWNLMIDVIAQTGRFPSSAGDLSNFNVEGERRYWVHVALDRYTGKVIDEQVEEVKE